MHGILGGNDLTQAIEQSAAMSAMAAMFGHAPGVRDVRGPHLEAFAPVLPAHARILDVGCGSGDSLRALAAHYADARLTGIDLSPAMIAVGRYRNADRGFELLHRAGEDMRFADGAFDLVHECAVAHETPRFASIRRFAEAYRVLAPGGVFLFIDQDPASRVIARQLRKNPMGHLIEPHIRSYSTLDVGETLARVGFAAVEKKKLHEASTIVVWVGRKG